MSRQAPMADQQCMLTSLVLHCDTKHYLIITCILSCTVFESSQPSLQCKRSACFENMHGTLATLVVQVQTQCQALPCQRLLARSLTARRAPGGYAEAASRRLTAGLCTRNVSCQQAAHVLSARRSSAFAHTQAWLARFNSRQIRLQIRFR